MYYRHNLDYKYPEKSDEHMIHVKHLRDTHFDENYEYVEKGLWYKIKRGTLQVALNTVGFLACRIRHGVKFYGRENLKKHKDLFKNGAITISNHVLMWDYLCVLRAIRPRLQRFPAWKTNFEGPNGPLIRWVGGVPIPTHSFRAMAKFKTAIEGVLKTKQWIHFYPEGSMWFYYPDIRPFKKAVFKYAVEFDKPVIPITLSFRPRGGIYKLFGKAPLVDVTVGEPILADKTVDKRTATDIMHKAAYRIMQGMAGIFPGDATYNEDQNVDNYVKTM